MEGTITLGLPIANPLEPTLFHKSWWLDIATDHQCEYLEHHDGQNTVGRLPYYLQRNKLGLKVITPPPLTFFAGPAVDVGPGKSNTQFLKHYRITQCLLEKLPKSTHYYFKCHSDIHDTLGFQKCGFSTAVQFTHVITPAAKEELWDSFRTKARNMIRSARRCHEFERGFDPELFMRFYEQNLSAKGKTNYRNKRICTALISACLQRGCGQIYQVRDSRGELASAMFCAWDANACHYLMTTRRPNSHSGATPLMVWHAVQDASERGLVFDFDGVVSEGGIRFANNFTANIQPRYIAIKDSALYTVCNNLITRKPKLSATFRPNPA